MLMCLPKPKELSPGHPPSCKCKHLKIIIIGEVMPKKTCLPVDVRQPYYSHRESY